MSHYFWWINIFSYYDKFCYGSFNSFCSFVCSFPNYS